MATRKATNTAAPSFSFAPVARQAEKAGRKAEPNPFIEMVAGIKDDRENSYAVTVPEAEADKRVLQLRAAGKANGITLRISQTEPKDGNVIVTITPRDRINRRSKSDEMTDTDADA